MTGRHSTAAIVLHWLVAALIVVQLVLGWRLGEAEGVARQGVLALHKSFGVAVLILALAWLGWRRLRPQPPRPDSLSPLDRRLPRWVHAALYLAMVGLPLTGWAMISSTRAGGATRLFGLVPWPRAPLLPLLPPKVQAAAADLFGAGHGLLVWLLLALALAHLAGALKHQFVDRDEVLARMAPGATPGRLFEPGVIAFAAAVLAIGAATYTPPDPGRVARPPVRAVASADLYLDVIAPALTRRCESCHNGDRARGGLSVSRYQDLMAGGADGAVVVKGEPDRSDLYRRITLPSGHRDYMPADNRTPLSDDEVRLIRWWIALGAPASVAVGSLEPGPDLLHSLARTLGLPGDGS